MSHEDHWLDEIDAVTGQLAWSAGHPHIARPETVSLLHDRLEVAQAELARLQRPDGIDLDAA
ncbi:MAG: hypothetical protein ACQETV_08845 [Actinomycetota bacterium]